MSKCFLNKRPGRSTRPDVQSLLEKFPPETLKAGVRIGYEIIGEIIGAEKGAEKATDNRWRTVVAAWTKRLRVDHNIVFETEDDAFVVMTNNERVRACSKALHSARNKIDRTCQVNIQTPTEGLTEEELRTHRCITNIGSTFLMMVNVERKNLRIKIPQIEKRK